MNVLKARNTGVKTQYQGAYEIFGALRATDMVVERYIRIHIRIRYLEVRPYLNMYCNKRHVSKAINNYSEKYSKESQV